MNIYGFYGEHLDNQTEWDGLSIRSDDGLNRRWRSNTVHPFLFSSETISKGRTQIVFQLEHFIAHFSLRYFAYVFTAHALPSHSRVYEQVARIARKGKLGKRNDYSWGNN